ncbi:MAG: AsmA family protein [Sphingomonadales bacterium]|nr:AsmA family protein [Sphingomonadales bacterium]NCO49677.1 AsmA family protein [Sphingomonadales bacterium]NCP00530.1 AsmA family protein [Sphingomonadales bacterium]NCP26092.1 AsmA family protein [Sphingomonadales bacterium]NCP44381.1 AsmA family protein [Sphingomonadales bacterium]
MNETAERPTLFTRRRTRNIIATFVATIVLLILFLGAVPASLLRTVISNELRGTADRDVEIGAVTRDSVFSYSPVITAHNVRVAQPAWAGKGDFLTLKSISARVGVLDVIMGNARPDRVMIDGLDISLVRNKDGRANWNDDDSDDDKDKNDRGPGLTDLDIVNSHFSFTDQKRALSVEGPISVNSKTGLRAEANGTFMKKKASLVFTGGAIAGIDPEADYPFEMSLQSPALQFSAKGRMQGVLNTDRFTASLSAKAPTLKNLDQVIEAGLFGTQPINLRANVRHEQKDWFVQKLSGTIGRSKLTGKADVLKRDGRTKIDADINAATLDFDDLADDEGLAKAAALTRKIGPRVIPNTRINLSKMGATDGQIDFTVDRLLSRRETVFRRLKGKLSMDHRVIKITNLIVGLKSGQMTGSVQVDHRSGAPKLSTDLTLQGASLQDLIGNGDIVTANMRGRIKLSGSGDTIRAALEKANGKAAMVASGGSIRATVAHVLGQNLSGAVGKIIDDPTARVPLRCLVANFKANNGVLTPAPLAVDTEISIGRGEGQIKLDGESISLILRGGAKGKSALHIVDPIKISGTLNAPEVSVAGLGKAEDAEKPSLGDVLKVATKSIGSALGIGSSKKQDEAFIQKPKSLNCNAVVAAAMR